MKSKGETLIIGLVIVVVVFSLINQFETDNHPSERGVIQKPQLEANTRKSSSPATEKPQSEPESTYCEEDLHLLAKLIEGESGGEPREGKLAVGTVVMNRIKDKNHPNNIKDVIYQPSQFSVVWLQRWPSIKPSEDSKRVARKVLEGYRHFGEEIIFFYNPEIATDRVFINSVNPVLVIENHTFARR